MVFSANRRCHQENVVEQRFLRRLVQIPCQILQRGRRLLYRLLNVNDWTETLLSGVPSPKRVRYG